jgi:hypothetical protein
MFLLNRPTLVRLPVVVGLLLSACSIPGVRWKDAEVVGPPLASGQPTKQVHRCDVVTAHSPWASTGHFNRCDIAFRSDTGVQIDAFAIQREISAALPRALPLRPLLEQFKNSTAGMKGSTLSENYALYLVAVSPAVVVGVPSKNGDLNCSGPSWTRCFTVVENDHVDQRYSRRSDFAVHYNTRAPVRNGAFILIPEWQGDSAPLPAEVQSAKFSHGGSTVDLVQRDGEWHVSGRTR